MKRLFLIALLLLLTACAGKTETVPNPDSLQTPSSAAAAPIAEPTGEPVVADGIADHFTYPNSNSASSFAVDENGVVYIYTFEMGSTGQINPQTGISEIPLADVTAYNLLGNKTAEYSFPTMDSPSHMCVGGGKLYYSSGYTYMGSVYSYDFETSEQETLNIPASMFDNDNGIIKITYHDGKIYILGIVDDYKTNEFDEVLGLDRSTGEMVYLYQYDGRILAAYDIESKTTAIIYDGLIQDFAFTPYGTILIEANDPEYDDYTHQSIGRFYFSELNLETMTMGERIYRSLAFPCCLSTDGQGVILTASSVGMHDAQNKLFYWSLGEDTGASEMAADVTSFGENEIAYWNGFTFYFIYNDNRDSHLLARVRNSAVVDITPPVKIISANITSEIPRSGFNISLNPLPYNEFSLAVLSGGAAYDAAVVNSNQDFAYNLREKGSFYPLNDVPGVTDYLNACFPYVREAATDKNGDIWMLPLSVDAAAIIYNAENCASAGLNFADTIKFAGIVSAVRQVVVADPSGRNYAFSPTLLINESLAKYLGQNDTLDTPEFRELAAQLKDFAGLGSFIGSSLPYMNADFSPNPDFLFDGVSLQTSSHLINRNDLSIAPLTGSDGLNPTNCTFICVNPHSDNLEKTLGYISAVCAYLTDKKDAGMLESDTAYTSSAYAQSRRALYANASIYFNVSDEVFAAEFDRYLADEISLDELIKEAGRKLAMYKGE